MALFIAAIMFAMGYGAINQGAQQSRVAEGAAGAPAAAADRRCRLLEQDFVQAAPRPVRAAGRRRAGSSARMLGGTPGTQPVVALTRAGWSNPAGLQRPGLQRVAYFLENGTLRREYWDVLDPTLASTTAKRDLLEHVKSFTIRYLDAQRNGSRQWPPLTSTVQSGPTMETSLRQTAARGRDHARHR